MAPAIFHRRHYEALAVILRALRGRWRSEEDLIMVVQALADAFEQDNPRFKRAYFFEEVSR